MAKASPAMDKLDAFGVEQVLERIANRSSLAAIALEVGVSEGSLNTWLAADPERSARVRDVRMLTAKLWDERAESEIANAPDEFSLRKAKELAHHYRWRAAKIAPAEYGDRMALEHSGELKTTTDEQLESRIAQLVAEARAGDVAGGTGSPEAD